MLPVKGTGCTCKNKILTWNAESQACTCPTPDTQIFVVSPKASCITCDESVNAEEVDPDDPKKCLCAEKLLFIDGRCSCGKTSAITKDIDGVILGCVNCNNSAKYLKNRKNETTCNCISAALKWDGVNGVCACPDSKVPYGKAASLKCVTCKGANIVGPFNLEDDPEADISKCECPSELFTFSISTKGVPSCTCTEKNSIVTFTQECLQCPVIANGGLGAIFAAHECKCANTFFWSYVSGECKKCSEVDQAKISGGNNLVCACETGLIWDVIT